MPIGDAESAIVMLWLWACGVVELRMWPLVRRVSGGCFLVGRVLTAYVWFSPKKGAEYNQLQVWGAGSEGGCGVVS